MKEREYLLSLYEIYSDLLSDSQRKYFEDYYYEDLSLQEIALNNKVSKSYVSKIINNTSNKLIKYEDSLKLYIKNNKIKEIIKDLDDNVRIKIEELL